MHHDISTLEAEWLASAAAYEVASEAVAAFPPTEEGEELPAEHRLAIHDRKLADDAEEIAAERIIALPDTPESLRLKARLALHYNAAAMLPLDDTWIGDIAIRSVFDGLARLANAPLICPPIEAATLVPALEDIGAWFGFAASGDGYVQTDWPRLSDLNQARARRLSCRRFEAQDAAPDFHERMTDFLRQRPVAAAKSEIA